MKDILQRSTPSDGFNQINPHRPIKNKKKKPRINKQIAVKNQKCIRAFVQKQQGVFFFSLEEGRGKRGSKKEKGQGSKKQVQQYTHTLIFKKRKTDTRKNPSVPLFTSLRVSLGKVRVLTSISTLDFSTLFCLLFVVKVKGIISSS